MPDFDRILITGAAGALGRARFEATGTGLNTCQQGAQMAQMEAAEPGLLDRAEAVLHCKDWLYLKLTGVRATDPSEASWTFGNFRTRAYDDTVIAALGLTRRRGLLPPIVEGTETSHPLTAAAAAATGLRAGTPVCLGYVDMVMTALGAGVYTGDDRAACTVIGSTGVHLRAERVEAVRLNDEGTGYVMALPVPGMVTQMQTNMAAALNIDWALRLAADLLSEAGQPVAFSDLVPRIDGWLAAAKPGALLYHPYISEAGERGPVQVVDDVASPSPNHASWASPRLVRDSSRRASQLGPSSVSVIEGVPSTTAGRQAGGSACWRVSIPNTVARRPHRIARWMSRES